VEQLAATTNPDERRRLRDQICTQVVAKAREVRKYVDPGITVNFGVVAVPDAVYELSTDAQVTCFDLDVVLVAYSMFVPYLLLVFQTVLKTSSDIDLEKLDSHLRLAEQTALEIQQELEGRFSRAITMLANSKSDMSALLSKLGNSITNIHTGADRSMEAHLEDLPRISDESW
jgi:DNA recombination protein RmuC